ncbi:MAG TPA: YdcF family protein [Gaiellaceae bacterium]|nr:YdcF family protein [Gaiellaceae bacterium]
MRKLLSFLVFVAVVAYGFGIWLFLLHPDDRLPRTADAVVVLAGGRTRLPLAERLVERQKVADTLVVSQDSQQHDPRRFALCDGPKPKGYRLICRFASPLSTRGEARLIASLAAEHNWVDVVVVSSRYHLYRAKLLIDRCTNAEIDMRGSDGDRWWRKALAIPLEYAKLLRAVTFQRGC